MNSVKLFLSLFLLLVIPLSAQPDLDKYKAAVNTKDKTERIETLKQFRAEFPESKYLVNATYELFKTYLDQNNLDSAITYASVYINTFPKDYQANGLNSVAYSLAQKKVLLDSAEAYASRAIEIARNGNPRLLSAVLDTKALVMYEKGDYNEALALQSEAMTGNENDPGYLYNLALYSEAAGKTEQAFNTAATAAILGHDKAVIDLNSWIKKHNISSDSTENLVMGKVDQYLKAANSAPAAKAKSASFMAQTGVNIDQAQEMAASADESVSKDTPIEEILTIKIALAQVHKAKDNYDDALDVLLSVNELASPWDTDYWYLLASGYEAEGEEDEAVDAYISGVLAYQSEMFMDKLKALGLDETEVEKRIEQKKEELSSFEPEHKSAPSNGKVVLAELFTGAECPPCVAADRAFDLLSESYPRDAVVILEYHLHIPGPDPMTNPDAFKMYQSYGANFGTPTTFFDGGEKMVGGGPAFVVKNRYHLYQNAINRYLAEDPAVNISGTAVMNEGSVDVKVDIKKILPDSISAAVHIALTEKSIDYTGANGVSKHIFVVRDLVNGGEGVSLNLVDGTASINESIDLAQVQQELTAYSNDPTTDPSWRKGTPFNGWKANTDTLDSSDLAVVVWVKDKSTGKVLQARYFDLTGETVGSK